MRAEAWRRVARNGKACFKAHPFLALAAGAAVGAVLFSRPRRGAILKWLRFAHFIKQAVTSVAPGHQH